MVIIGEKDDEAYLKTIMKRLIEHDYVYIQILPTPKKLGQVEEYFQSFRWFGIRRIERIFDMDVLNPKKENEKMKVRVFRWDIIPALKRYREETIKVEIEEEMARKVV